MKSVNKIINWGLVLFVILLPWQTRWIFSDSFISGEVFEYGRMSLYASEIILLIILFFGLIKADKLHFRGVCKYLALLLVWSAVVIVWSPDKLLAVYGSFKLLEGIGLFWLIAKNQSSVKYLIHGLIISGFIQALFGISQFVNQQAILANKWLGMSFINPVNAGTSVIEFLDQRWLRAYGSLSHPNILGGFLAVCLIVTIISLYKFTRRIENKNFLDRGHLWLNVYYWSAVVVIFFGLLVSFSRSAWLGFVVAFVVLFIKSFINKEKSLQQANLKLAAVFIISLAMLMAVFPYQLVTTRVQSQSRLEQLSLSERQTAYSQSAKILQDNWYLGTGFNNYTVILTQQDPTLVGWAYQPVHNTWLLWFIQLGLVGLVLFLLVIKEVVKQTSVYWPLLLCLLVIGLFDHYLISFYFGMMLFWLALAVSYQEN